VRADMAGGFRVYRVSNEDFAARRARWLAELASALDDARDVVKELNVNERGFEAVELCAQIEAVRLEVHTIRLRRSRGGGEHIDPEWTKDIPWKRSA
jgi:hypothetical protein